MAPDSDYQAMVERFEQAMFRASGSPASAGLDKKAFAAGCRYLREQGLGVEEIALVFGAPATEVRKALGAPPARRRWLAAAAAALIVAAALAFLGESGGRFEVEVSPEVFRAPGVLSAGGSFSLELKRLPRPAYILVVRVDPRGRVSVDFPDVSQAARRLAEGDRVPGRSGGAPREFLAGSEAGTVTLVVAASESPLPPLEDLLKSLTPARASPEDSLATVLEELARRGLRRVALLELEVTP